MNNNLIKWEPFRDLDRIFDNELFVPTFVQKLGDLAADLSEDNDNLYAEIHLPGIDPEKVDISVEDGLLRVSGSREEEKEHKEKNFYSKEIRRGSFERVLRLPVAVKNNETRAEYKSGVLKITLPKKDETKPAKVKIQVKN